MKDFEMNLEEADELDALESAWYFIFGSSWAICVA
jgi:hypothetical protein